MTGPGRILVVDDEPQIARVLRTTLSTQGYEVRTAGDVAEALGEFRDWSPGLVITDISMPKGSGVELCRAIRDSSAVPIIVLSVKGDEKTKVEALDAGADDYVTKPFGMPELLARVRANFRRLSPPREGPIEVGDFRIDPESRMVFVRGKEVRLTPKEFDLLSYMARSPGKVITHRKLLATVWGGQSVTQPEYLRVFVSQLRKKIEPGEEPRYLLTEPWVGYRFQPAPDGADGTDAPWTV
jgi:two-component system KDP operon response regulator KdpE